MIVMDLPSASESRDRDIRWRGRSCAPRSMTCFVSSKVVPFIQRMFFKYESVVMNGVIIDLRERLCNIFVIWMIVEKLSSSFTMMTRTRFRYFRMDIGSKEKSSLWYHRFLILIIIDCTIYLATWTVVITFCSRVRLVRNEYVVRKKRY